MLLLSLLTAAVSISGCAGEKTAETTEIAGNETVQTVESTLQTAESTLQTEADLPQETLQTAEEENAEKQTESEVISWNSDWKYAENSEIHTGSAVLYYMASSQPRGKTICINAGHGTSGGSEVYTLCHPDGSPKVTGGSTAKGQTKATAVSEGTTMKDGTP